MKNRLIRSVVYSTAAVGAALTTPAFGQEALEEIIVTARRVEERLQDVPISITVFSQEELAKNNIISAKDIAAYTPGLSTNARYGADNTTWTIRGFTQEQRTTATVGSYFADVVAPRGSGATQGGDGAGPGALFDLQNVQVLKGPQGTLQGRNSTGGAVMLTPRKPTNNLEGYVEGSAGNYGMWRTQGVINLPANDSLRFRLGVDHNERDGYMKNVGLLGSGPNGKDMGSVDYTAVRLSVVADLTPNLENYTIATYSKSKSSSTPPKITKCYAAAACAQMDREASAGFWSVSNPLPDAGSTIKQSQIINTTTWKALDDLTVKNIVSYGEFRGDLNLDLFGAYTPNVPAGTETSGNDVKGFSNTHRLPGHHTNAESSLVEELQFQGRLLDGGLVWQGGFYFESSKPLGLSGVESNTFTPCTDINTLNCIPLAGGGALSLGRISYSTTRTSFQGKAVYFQTSYDLTSQLKLTGGIRYTEDRMKSTFQVEDLRLGNSFSIPAGQTRYFNGTAFTNPPTASVFEPNWAVCTNTVSFGIQGSATNPYMPIDNRFDMCRQTHSVKTTAPTWLLGLDYKPFEDGLLYVKWSRGYRQGGINAFGADGLQDYNAEKVDTYEGGAKVSWHGAAPGFANLAVFYNDFRDQQLQLGVQCNPVSACAQTTAILNAGKSMLKGFEFDTGIIVFNSLKLDASYAYLKTKVEEIQDVTPTVLALGLPYNDFRQPSVGSPIPNSIPHKVSAGATYTLPLPESVGKVSAGTNFVYQSQYRVVDDAVKGSNNGVLPQAKWFNLNFGWENIVGLPLDASIFVTNVNNEKIYLHVNDQQTNGFASYFIGEPRMWGARVRYKFGS